MYRLIDSSTTRFGALIIASAVVWPAQAQTFNRAQINRPSLIGPSQQIGQLGGNFTGRLGDVLGGGLPSSSISRAADSAVFDATPGGGRFGFRGGDTTFRRNRFGSNVLPPIATPSANVADFGFRPTNTLLDQLAPSRPAVEAMAGLTNAMHLGTPLGARLGDRIPLTHTTFTPPAAISPYHDFFGLVAAGGDEPSELAHTFGKPGVPPQDNLDALALAELQDQQATRDQTGVALFREATRQSPTTVAQFEELSNTVRQLERWRRNDPSDYRSVLLLGHVALETDSITTAITSLSEAARRRPTLFIDGTDPGAYFGDREVYQRQLRKFIRTVGTSSKETPESLVIEAYCALLLGDKVRAQDATERAEKLATEKAFAAPVESGGVNTLIWSIRAAVQQ